MISGAKISVQNDPVFHQLCTTLERNPLAVNSWERVINHLLKNYLRSEKKLPEEEKTEVVTLLRTTYQSMLTVFPYLENYAIEYGNFEFEEGNYKKFHTVFRTSLKNMNNRSLLLWVSYLKILVDQKEALNVENKFILHRFQDAEKYIGLHYYSQPFWNLYLLFLKQNYIADPRLYLQTLRRLLKHPIYDFAYNYRLWLKELDSVSDYKQLKLFYNMSKIEVPRLLKPREKLELSKFKIKKFYKKEYKKIEEKVMKLYNNFELPLTVFKQCNQYYTSPRIPLSRTFIRLWESYISYAISTKNKHYVMLVFQRALTASSVAHSRTIWLRFIRWLVGIGDRASAEEILRQSARFVA